MGGKEQQRMGKQRWAAEQVLYGGGMLLDPNTLRV
jgi:hypothetical protein